MRRLATLVLLGTATVACGHGGGTSVADAGPEPVDAGAVDCSSDPRVMAYAPGMSVADPAGDRKYALMQSTPAPPARGDNSWELEITDGSGQPLPGLELRAAAFMPDHGHGSSVVPVITDEGGGSYNVNPLYFFMPGVWRITISDADGGAPAQSGVFFFCIEG